MTAVKKAEIIAGLQTDILRLQGFKSRMSSRSQASLDFMKEAFPQGEFPLGAVHEFLSGTAEDMASVCGFISGLISTALQPNGIFLWISPSKKVFPPALRNFSLHPDRFIFIYLQNEKNILWVMEEALKCGALSAVICETRTLSFTESRRLQLAVEKSQVTGFVIRNNNVKLNPTACVSRWKISPAISNDFEGLPGVNFPKWKVELLRMRNGKSGCWEIEWRNGKFRTPENVIKEVNNHKLKVG